MNSQRAYPGSDELPLRHTAILMRLPTNLLPCCLFDTINVVGLNLKVGGSVIKRTQEAQAQGLTQAPVWTSWTWGSSPFLPHCRRAPHASPGRKAGSNSRPSACGADALTTRSRRQPKTKTMRHILQHDAHHDNYGTHAHESEIHVMRAWTCTHVTTSRK